MKLSGQAQWYLAGKFPVYVKPAYGQKAPEPKAMQELVNAGFATFEHEPIGDCWMLTEAGINAKTKGSW